MCRATQRVAAEIGSCAPFHPLNRVSRQDVTIDNDQFWNLLIESKLVDLSAIQRLIEEFETASAGSVSPNSNANDVANWLQKKQLLTSYQAQILLAGHSGPVRFGDYVVTDQLTSTPFNYDFRGKHLATGFPVHLQFMAGNQQSDLKLWNQIEALTAKVASLDESNLVAVFESVVLPAHRFVVSESRRGKKLSELIPHKGRMPWADACVIMAHVARGLDQLHQRGIVHNAISPRSIWVQNGGWSKVEMSLFPDSTFEKPDRNRRECRLDYLAPEVLSETSQITVRSDLYAFGCTLYRIIAGKTVFPVEDLEQKSNQHLLQEPAQLEKYQVPPPLQELLDQLLSKEPERRPSNAATIASQLCKLAGKPDLLKMTSTGNSDKLQAFRARLRRDKIDNFDITGVPRAEHADFTGQLQTSRDSASASEATPRTTRQGVAPSAIKRNRSKWKMPLAVAAGLVIVSGLIGLFAYQANRTPLVLAPERGSPDLENVPPVAVPPIELTPPVNPNLVQVLIDDDDATLWESPTAGPPLDLSFHPAAARIIFAIRPAELLSHSEGKQLLRGLGPVLNQRIKHWREQLGLEFDEMERLIITLHPGQQSAYEPFVSIKLKQSTIASDLISKIGSLTVEKVGDIAIYNKPDGTAFYFISDHADEKPQDDVKPQATTETGTEPNPGESSVDAKNISRFVFGKADAVREVAESAGLNVLSGTMRKLVDRSDADRHFSFLFLRPAMFNEQGQALMGGQLATLNRQLDLFLQDEIRGGIFSFHVDQGDYFEITFDQTVDLETRELKESLESRLRVFRDDITQFLAKIPANEYWDRVRLRYDNMLADVYRNLRWDVEYGTVVGNCWLPPMAGHNLVGATELVTAFSSDSASSGSAAVEKKIPASLDELLLTKRNLSVTTNPDLNLLLSGIRAEILDDFGELPFDFEIRLIGNDLQKEGITQNQRPGNFQINNKSLAEILAEIMVRCNPDKNVSGPHDLKCKLVWALGPDPANPGNQAILITTRAGVAARNLTLPKDFQPQ